MTLKRKMTDRSWGLIKVGSNVTVISRADLFAPRLDHGGSPVAEGSAIHGNVIHKQDDYLVMEDVHSFVIKRDEIHKVVQH